MSILIGCSGARHISKSLARSLKIEHSYLDVNKFPDNEIDIKFNKEVRNKKVYLVQSFYGNVNERIVETLFAGYTAKSLRARKIILVALYFPYLRKDKRFRPRECVSAKVMSKLFSKFDKIYIVEPHLHRIKKIKKLIKKGKRISVVSDIADYAKKIKEPVIIGPDMESFQWANSVAKLLKRKAYVLEKKRYGSRSVKVKVPNINVKNENVVIIDDIISTGSTMLETIKGLKKLKPKKIYCIAIHGIFTNDSLSELKKHAEVVSCNTIPSKVAKIDVTETVAKEVR